MSDQSARKRLDGKTAIITGATGGIGEATAKLFLEEGANVMLVGRSPDKLRETQTRLDGGSRVASAVADAVDEAKIAAAVAKTVETFGGVDVMFANAGTEGAVKGLDELTEAEFNDVLQINVVGVWMAMKHCVAPMKARGSGSIIATSSIAGQVGLAGASAYIASKHAVYGLVKSAALELAGSKIRVNAVAPGCIDNRMIKSIETQIAPDNPDAVRDSLFSSIAMGRYGTNEEIAKLTAFLASDDASYCTGSIFTADGGYVAA